MIDNARKMQDSSQYSRLAVGRAVAVFFAGYTLRVLFFMMYSVFLVNTVRSGNICDIRLVIG